MSSDSERYYGVSIPIQEEKSPAEVYAAEILTESETREDGLDQSSKGFLYFPLSQSQQTLKMTPYVSVISH